MTGRAAVYERVSTLGQTVENQTPAILSTVERDEAELSDDRKYIERVSAYDPGAKRPALERLLKDATSGRLKGTVLYFFALSRLSRRGIKHTLDLIGTLRKCGMDLVSVSEPWLDTRRSNPMGELLIAIFAAVANIDSYNKSLATRAGLARARAEGVKLGRPALSPEIVARIKTMSAEGIGVRAIARSLRISPGSVSKTLQKAGTKPQGLTAGSGGSSPA